MKRTRRPNEQRRITLKGDFIVLSNDPSFTAWGYVLINGRGVILEAGCIKTKPKANKLRIRKGDDLVRRIGEIYDVLLNQIDKYEVSYMLTELPHGSQNSNAAIMIGAVTAICQGIHQIKGIPIEWYSEADGKQAVLGKETGTKSAMIKKIDKKYKVPWTKFKYKNEAIADALAIHYAAVKVSPLLQFFDDRGRK